MKPNILWIFVDEHAAYALGCAGDPNIETPHLDRLQNEGVRFTRAYSNTPICVPARGCVHTGQYITTHGAKSNHRPLLPGKTPEMAEVMREAGYRTSHYGKWHLSGGTVNQHFVSPYFRPGWDEWIGWECMHGKAGNGTHYDTTYGEGDVAIRANQIDKFQTDWLTDRTVEMIEKQDGNHPWFHVVSIETPHPPCDLPNLSKPHWKQFKDKEIKWRPNVPDKMKNDEFTDFVRGYYSHIANIDDNVGRILDTLEKTGQLENTIIIFFSDHGDHQGAHGRRCGKSTPTEESAQIPFIVRIPSCLDVSRKEHETDAFISLVDLMPTTLGLCGVDIPQTVEGQDLSKVVIGETEHKLESIYLQFESSYFALREPHRFWRAIRKGDWMYSVNQEIGPEYLFNLAEDPYEMNNLVDDPEYKDIITELHNDMKQKADELNDDFFSRS